MRRVRQASEVGGVKGHGRTREGAAPRGGSSLPSSGRLRRNGSSSSRGDRQDGRRRSVGSEGGVVKRMRRRVAQRTCLNNNAQPCVEIEVEILGIIGFGTFAVVCEGAYTDSRGGRVSVAVKFPKEDELAVKALEKEKTVLKDLPPHANIIQVLGGNVTFFHSDRIPSCVTVEHFIVMERMSSTLELLVHPKHGQEGSRKTYQKWLQIFYAITSGLLHLHNHGITHFDLKPGNILIDSHHENVKLADFGISRHNTAKPYSSKPYQHGGTRPYLPPECQLPVQKSPPTPVASVDVFSLGVIMWEAVTGRRSEVPLVQDEWFVLEDGHPAALRQLIYDCLQVDAFERPSCREVSCRLAGMMACEWVAFEPSKRSSAS